MDIVNFWRYCAATDTLLIECERIRQNQEMMLEHCDTVTANLRRSNVRLDSSYQIAQRANKVLTGELETAKSDLKTVGWIAKGLGALSVVLALLVAL